MCEKLKTKLKRDFLSDLTSVKSSENGYNRSDRSCLLRDTNKCSKNSSGECQCGGCVSAKKDQILMIKIAEKKGLIKVSGPVPRSYAQETALDSKLRFKQKEVTINHSEGRVKVNSY